MEYDLAMIMNKKISDDSNWDFFRRVAGSWKGTPAKNTHEHENNDTVLAIEEKEKLLEEYEFLKKALGIGINNTMMFGIPINNKLRVTQEWYIFNKRIAEIVTTLNKQIEDLKKTSEKLSAAKDDNSRSPIVQTITKINKDFSNGLDVLRAITSIVKMRFH